MLVLSKGRVNSPGFNKTVQVGKTCRTSFRVAFVTAFTCKFAVNEAPKYWKSRMHA